jgi:YHS domain-containing protein
MAAVFIVATSNGAFAAAKKPLVNVDKNGVILKGYDAVAYFKQHKAVKGDPKYSSKYEGATYYFASAEDKAEFDKSPAKYAPQYGGFCAYSMSKRRIALGDPNNFFHRLPTESQNGSRDAELKRVCGRLSAKLV